LVWANGLKAASLSIAITPPGLGPQAIHLNDVGVQGHTPALNRLLLDHFDYK